MKTLKVIITDADNEKKVVDLLQKLQSENAILFQEITRGNESEPATEDQIQEMIDEAELAPYYSEKEAKKILNL
jgi:hypothetical protein